MASAIFFFWEKKDHLHTSLWVVTFIFLIEKFYYNLSFGVWFSQLEWVNLTDILFHQEWNDGFHRMLIHFLDKGLVNWTLCFASYLQLVSRVYKDEEELEMYIRSDTYGTCGELRWVIFRIKLKRTYSKMYFCFMFNMHVWYV